MQARGSNLARLMAKPLLLFSPASSGYMWAGLGIIAVFLFISAAAPLLTPYSPTLGSDETLLPPLTSGHLLGTDNLGRDLWARLLYGGRTVLYIVMLSIAIAVSAGLPLGLLSGYLGGPFDRLLNIVMDSLYAFPSLLLAISVALMLGPSPLNTALAIAFVYVPTYFRMIRGQVLSLKAQPFVEAGRALGLRVRRILFRHLLPNLLPTLVVVFSLSAADAILTEAGLSFLGYSVPPPTPDWGYDLYSGREFLQAGYYWLSFYPGLMVVLLSMGFALVGEALNERYGVRA
jgi:peptide/nickel transport system permease protein